MSIETPELIVTQIDARPSSERFRDFSELLNKIEGVDDKKKQLWREIYENAITDRQNAFVMFVKLATITDNKSTEHAVHGRTMTAYIERMSKANDQLIRLADLINQSEASVPGTSDDDMFSMISGNKK
jgi:hypothetical protein